MADEEGFFVVIGVDEPTCDSVGAVADDFARVGLEYINAIDFDLDLVVVNSEPPYDTLVRANPAWYTPENLMSSDAFTLQSQRIDPGVSLPLEGFVGSPLSGWDSVTFDPYTASRSTWEIVVADGSTATLNTTNGTLVTLDTGMTAGNFTLTFRLADLANVSSEFEVTNIGLNVQIGITQIGST